MEDFSQLGGKSFVFASSSTTVGASSPPPAALAPPPTTSTYGSGSSSSSSYATPLHHHHHHLDYSSTSLLAAKPEGASSPPPRGAAGGQARDEDAIKAKIVSHPHYSNLVRAYMDCHKVGAPADVAARLSAIAGEFVARQRAVLSFRDAPSDPELDQFMEAYYHMLVKYREELARPLQEAMDFLSRVESQLKSLTDGSLRLHSSEEKCEACSSEEDLDVSGGEDEIPEFDPRAEERELKHRLLKKYSGYLGSLRQELSKKKKKGKLPKDARQKLLNWWELHYKWPYPSETEKVALAESTGLDQKQINNWFINQRKRHWKPSEDMQFVVDSYYPPNASSFYVGGHFMGDAAYRP